MDFVDKLSTGFAIGVFLEMYFILDVANSKLLIVTICLSRLNSGSFSLKSPITASTNNCSGLELYPIFTLTKFRSSILKKGSEDFLEAELLATKNSLF